MITGITQPNAAYTSVSEARVSKILPAKNDGNVNTRQELAAKTVASGSLDFTNMSPREFGDLAKSGRFGDDLPPLMLSLDATKNC